MARLEGILWRSYKKMKDDRLLAVAGGVVFYALLALFPAVTTFVSLYGLVADASTIDQHLSLAAGILPSGAVDILHEQLTRLTGSKTSALSFGFLFGLVFALWSGNPTQSRRVTLRPPSNGAAEHMKSRAAIRNGGATRQLRSRSAASRRFSNYKRRPRSGASSFAPRRRH